MAGLSSASRFIAQLHDPEPAIQVHGLKKLVDFVDQFWPEIAENDTILLIENLYESDDFPHQNLAALLAAKVFYHLGKYHTAMEFALGAGELFDINENSEFVQALIVICIDHYKDIQISNNDNLESGKETVDIDPRLESVVERMFEKCLQDEEFKQGVGIALETRRMDKLEEVFAAAGDNIKEVLSYTYRVSMDLVANRVYRRSVLDTLVNTYQTQEVRDYVNMVRCLVFLDDSSAIVRILFDLVNSNQDDIYLGFQIAFELVDNATQQFVKQVREGLDTIESENNQKDLDTLKEILTGGPTINFYLEFLYSKNHTDMGVLNKIKSLFEPKYSVLHTGTIITNAFVHCGTTRDTFLQKNLEWLSRALNWSKFTTTAALGVIHKGHLKEAMNVLDPYLPKPGVTQSPYIEGGSLFGLGLIHANHGEKISSYLLQQLRNIDAIPNEQQDGIMDSEQRKEIVQHGAALGLGVAAMASHDDDTVKALLSLLLHQDSAVAGEAAGVAIGLVKLGCGENESIEAMMNFAHTCQHEKIIRGLSLGLALMMYNREEEADPLIDIMNADADPIIRYGAQFMIGLAYCGSANNKAISKLLHVAVSDVNDDVRRAAVICLGFVLFRQPEQVPRMVSLLAVSYNPHVRYGAAMALGIACAGSGLPEAIELLTPLLDDAVPFVKQGAFIAMAMVLIQVSEKEEPRAKEFRTKILDTIGGKKQKIMSKFGAILSHGILDAGGQNVTIALSSKAGHKNLSTIVGLTMFLQYWYWYPFTLFLSLSFTPTAIIAVNKNLQMPSYKMKSNAPKSLFSYPEKIKPPKEEVIEKVPTATLSTTKKAKARAAEKDNTMDVEEEEVPMDIEEETVPEVEVVVEEEEKEEEPFEYLDNPARVTRKQLDYISFDVDPRYVPVTEGINGVVILKDTLPEQEEEILDNTVPSREVVEDYSDEPEPPEPFLFLG
eukprot:TRINITY_DN7623_c0_g1_i1.p1 TRINITY_DN7623_c0_g1~~TRINITY_DN7623_c0_g1_i1.p1  ORF type:complete len:959 (+),score=269.00 TRINITY_DN7623_c0_g1_i1:39-2879(+)